MLDCLTSFHTVSPHGASMRDDFTLVATLIQAFGLVLLTVLSTVLAQAVPRDYCFAALDTLLAAVELPGRDAPYAVRVSLGLAPLGSEALEQTVEKADAAMYRVKQERKAAVGSFRP